jgi:hypothetical protein
MFDKIPQRLWKQRSGHTGSRYLADEDQVSAVLLHALRLNFAPELRCIPFQGAREAERAPA